MKLICRGDAGKPAVLLLHGFLGDGNDFVPILKSLSSTHCPYTLDLPGHGIATKIPGRFFDPADPVWELLDAALASGPKTWGALLGYSMGGRVAQALHERWPHRFASLILESSATGIPDLGERRERLAKDETLARRLESCDGNPAAFEMFLREWYGQPLFSGMNDVEETVRERLSGSPVGLARALGDLSVGHMPDMREHLRSHFGPGRKPLLLIAGEKDLKYRASMEELAGLTGGNLVVVPGCGHNVHRGNPGGYADAMAMLLHAPPASEGHAFTRPPAPVTPRT